VAVSIRPGRNTYSGFESDVPGLPLTAITSGSLPSDPRFHWRADFGEFRLWSAPASVVEELGSDATVGDVTVYWGYLGIPAAQDPVHVTVELLVAPDGNVLATNTLTLTWNAQGGVTVR
jgi:hypothetical protein